MKVNNLHVDFQSAYHQFHPTGTTLLIYKNKVLSEMDNQRLTQLFMFDLLAALDIIDHIIMLQRIFERFGVQGEVLKMGI